jgi:hypothetical protein
MRNNVASVVPHHLRHGTHLPCAPHSAQQLDCRHRTVSLFAASTACEPEYVLRSGAAHKAISDGWLRFLLGSFSLDTPATLSPNLPSWDFFLRQCEASKPAIARCDPRACGFFFWFFVFFLLGWGGPPHRMADSPEPLSLVWNPKCTCLLKHQACKPCRGGRKRSLRQEKPRRTPDRRNAEAATTTGPHT